LRLSKALEPRRAALARAAAAFGAALLPRSAPPAAPFSHLVTADAAGRAAGRTLSWLLALAGRRAVVGPGWVEGSARARAALPLPARGMWRRRPAPAPTTEQPLVFAGTVVVFSRACLAAEADGGAGLRAVAAAGGAARVAVVGAGGQVDDGAGALRVLGVTDGRGGSDAWARRVLPGGAARVMERDQFVEAVVGGRL